MSRYLIILLIITGCSTLPKENKMNDKYLYLEDVEGKDALTFANNKNRITEGHFKANPLFNKVEQDILAILDDPEKIPYAGIHGNYVYNFWRDKHHVRGLWRRMDKLEYLKGKDIWEIVLDIDKLAKNEKENWSWSGAEFEHYNNKRVIIELSRGGKDATVMREFDVETKKFILDGFNVLKECKGNISWINKDQVFVTHDFGEESLTVAGYPRFIKLWQRGTDLDKAEQIFETDRSFQYVWPMIDYITKRITIFTSPERYKNHFYDYDIKSNKATKYLLPEFINSESIKGNSLIVTPLEDWSTNKKKFFAGDLISISISDLLKGNLKSELIFRPKANQAVASVHSTKSMMLVKVLEDVKTKILIFKQTDSQWIKTELTLPDKMSDTGLFSVDSSRDDFFLYQESFLTPLSLYYYSPKKNGLQLIANMKSAFDESKFKVEQFFTTSEDGTKIPYFQVSAKNIKLDGNNPTVINAYGGFLISRLPYYSKIWGSQWLEKGGVYVLANIRGGGEYGPNWHKAALREKRQNAFNDFYAVTEDLINRKITTPAKLGIIGGSNGGLLVSVAFTQRPKLYSAVVCSVPLTDMERYNKLLAGYLWVGEYGDPDVKDDLDFLLKYSPFHQLKKNETYPKVLVTTSTKDDRVHPAHARKFVAKMEDLGHLVYYFENIDGGHAGASNNIQKAKILAIQFLYLYEQLKID